MCVYVGILLMAKRRRSSTGLSGWTGARCPCSRAASNAAATISSPSGSSSRECARTPARRSRVASSVSLRGGEGPTGRPRSSTSLNRREKGEGGGGKGWCGYVRLAASVGRRLPDGRAGAVVLFVVSCSRHHTPFESREGASRKRYNFTGSQR